MKWLTNCDFSFRCSYVLSLAKIFGVLCTASVLAQHPMKTLIVDVDHRPATSLDGNWHYLVDPVGRSLYAPDGAVRDSGYGLNEHPALVGERKGQEYDFANAPTLKVPGDWNTQEPTLFRYEGVLWYQRDFTFQPKPEMRTFLHIGAANYRSYVWVNQKRICEHEGGFTPFDCEVTAALRPGNNFVVIAVDSTRLVDGIPGLSTDWYNYGGLTRDVSLVDVPKAFVDDFDVHLKPGTWTVWRDTSMLRMLAEGTPVNIRGSRGQHCYHSRRPMLMGERTFKFPQGTSASGHPKILSSIR
jgi:beta-glucuronidase